MPMRRGRIGRRGVIGRPVARTAAVVGTAAVVTHGGYWDSTIEPDLTNARVTRVVIPRTGKPSKTRAVIEHAADFVTAVKWRTGCEGRISHLKRDWAWHRSRLRGHNGARIWCGHGVFAHNLIKLIELQR